MREHIYDWLIEKKMQVSVPAQNKSPQVKYRGLFCAASLGMRVYFFMPYCRMKPSVISRARSSLNCLGGDFIR